MAKMSGRGLGFTGGTADKLEAIPGYKIDLSEKEFKENVKEIGISLITSSLNLAPADKKIYALRDTIACTSSIPLIASSVMSKKIAAGASKILIDITCGDGAFMKDIVHAKSLAKTMIEIGKLSGKEVRCVITNMDEPVGFSIGNQLEIIETVKALKGEMPEDVKQIVIALGAQMLIMAGMIKKAEEAKAKIEEVINNGKAYEKFEELVKKQGGDISYIKDISKFKNAKHVIPILSDQSGIISKIKTEMLGNISVYIGAGRNKKEDKIDYQAGIIVNKKVGDIVKVGEPLATVYINDEEKLDGAVKNTKEAFILSNKKVTKKSVILDTMM